MVERVLTPEMLRDRIEAGEAIALLEAGDSPDVWIATGGRLERLPTEEATHVREYLASRTVVVAGRDAALYHELLSQIGIDAWVLVGGEAPIVRDAFASEIYPTVW